VLSSAHYRRKCAEPCTGLARFHSAADVRLIDEFVAAMRRGHYAPKTIARYRCCLIQAARSLKRGLGALRRETCRLLPDACRAHDVHATDGARHAAHLAQVCRALRARPFHAMANVARRLRRIHGGGSWVVLHHPLSISTSRTALSALAVSCEAGVWRRVRCADIWRYAAKLKREGYSPRSLNSELCLCVSFCASYTYAAIARRSWPKSCLPFRNEGRAPRREVASEEERRRLLAFVRPPHGRGPP